MSSLLRKHQQPLMIILTILTIIIFVGYWNGPTGSRNRLPQASDVVGKIYGNTVTKSTLQHEANKGALARQLNLDLFAGLAAPAQSMNEAIYNFALNSLVLQHEAERLQLEPVGDSAHTDERVADEIKSLARFQTEDGQFNPAAYTSFVSDYLPSLGFTASDLEDVVAEDIVMKKVKELLQTTFVVSPELFLAAYTQEYQKVDTSVIRFNLADFTAKIQVTDDDIKKAFEQHAEGYKSEEKRGVKFVTFALSDAEKKLTGKERMDALQKLSDAAGDFVQALQEKGAKFDDVAAKKNIPVTVLPPFAPSAPDPKAPNFTDFLQTVFTLTKENPISEPLQDQGTGSYYVVELGDIVPSRLLTLAEARPQIIDEVKTSRAQEVLVAQGRDVRIKIQADIAAGKSFADAAKAEGQKVEAYPPFSISNHDDLDNKPDAGEVGQVASEMKEGELSDFVPTVAGGVIVHVDKREPIDPKQFETDRARLEPVFDGRQVNAVFGEWLGKQHEAANITIAGSGNGTPVPPPPK